jgi:hypothetical protein
VTVSTNTPHWQLRSIRQDPPHGLFSALKSKFSGIMRIRVERLHPVESRDVQPAQSDRSGDELATLAARLEAAAQDLAKKDEALRLSRRQRDELMVQAVGMRA